MSNEFIKHLYFCKVLIISLQEHAAWLASPSTSIAMCRAGDIMLFWGGIFGKLRHEERNAKGKHGNREDELRGQDVCTCVCVCVFLFLRVSVLGQI